jgi:hypothetical protein
MLERFSAMLREHMDVIDANGDKVGTIGQVYQPVAIPSTTSTFAQPHSQAYMKVDTGFLGLGKDLYIPADVISDVTGDRVFLNLDKDRFDDIGWDREPDWLKDRH